MIFRAFLSLLALATLAPASVVAQTLDPAAQRELVSRLEGTLRQNYVFPDRIPAISAELDRRERQQSQQRRSAMHDYDES